MTKNCDEKNIARRVAKEVGVRIFFAVIGIAIFFVAIFFIDNSVVKELTRFVGWAWILLCSIGLMMFGTGIIDIR